jgi:prepilin-type N-terminal cleavage/methylation domain-containing protein/prepilin-type processing-associated H-X9-DG protein
VIRPPARPGFTLIEVLVATAVIAALAGIALPAVQKIRGTAARAQCMNNLKEIGTAIHNYEQATRKLPPGVTVPGWGWTTPLAPYLEQQAVYNTMFLDDASQVSTKAFWSMFNDAPLNLPSGAEPLANTNQNIAAAETVVKVFQCPAMQPPKRTKDEFLFFKTPTKSILNTVQNRCLATYIACLSGDLVSDFGISPTSVMNGTGMFQLTTDGASGSAARTYGLAMLECTDGLSNTLFVGEAHPVLEGKVETTSSTNPFPIQKDHWYFGSGSNQRKADWSEMLGTTGVPPNYVPLDASAAELGKTEFGFSSPHPGGLTALFGDGSVRFISNDIKPAVWSLIGKRNDGQTIEEF